MITREDRLDPVGCADDMVYEFDLPAKNIAWKNGERVGIDLATGIAAPLVAGLLPVGECIITRDLSAYANGAERIKVQAGAFEMKQDGTIADDVSINTPVYYNPSTNLATGSDGGGAYPFLGPLVQSLTSPGGTRLVKVDIRPWNIPAFGGVYALAKTITHVDLDAAALTQTVAIGVAQGRLLGGSKLLSANFTGGGATSCTLDLGGTDADGLIAADDVFAGPLAEDFAPPGVLAALGFMPSLAGQTINATFTSDVNVSLLTAGSVTLRLYFALV